MVMVSELHISHLLIVAAKAAALFSQLSHTNRIDSYVWNVVIFSHRRASWSSFSGSFVSPSRISLIESQKREKRKVKRNLCPFQRCKSYILFPYINQHRTHTHTNQLPLSPPTFFFSTLSIRAQLYQSRRQIHEVESIMFVTFCKKNTLAMYSSWFVTWIALYLLIVDIQRI